VQVYVCVFISVLRIFRSRLSILEHVESRQDLPGLGGLEYTPVRQDREPRALKRTFGCN
jgi:hypothetical protein